MMVSPCRTIADIKVILVGCLAPCLVHSHSCRVSAVHVFLVAEIASSIDLGLSLVILVPDRLAPCLADNGGTVKYYFALTCAVRNMEG